MIRNHLKIAYRHLLKNAFYTIVNVVGLVCAAVFTISIAAYIWQAYQVNAELRNLDQQYALQSVYSKPGMGLELTTLGALPRALQEEYPDLVANYYRLDGITCIVSQGDHVYEESAALGDSTLLGMYAFELYHGDATTALSAPFSVVITANTAVKYFGKTDVVGQVLKIRNFSGEVRDFAITGVLAPVSENSVFQLTPTMNNTMFLSLGNADYFGRNVDSWDNRWIAAFVELKPGVTPDRLELPLSQLLDKHADADIAANLIPNLKPLNTYYLDDNGGAVRKMVWILSLVVAFILIMVMVNFVNLNVSQAMSRVKELGVRKVMGSSRAQLIAQLMVESVLLVALSAVLALLMYPLSSLAFGLMLGKELPDLSQLPFLFFMWFGLGAILLGVFSSVYPAWRFSSNHIVHAVKGRLSGLREKYILRKVLVGVQFAVAIIVLVATFVVSRQVDLFFTTDIGYDKEYLMAAQVPRDWTPAGVQRMETLRQELLKSSAIEQISISYDVPGAVGTSEQEIRRSTESDPSIVQMINADQHFAETYGIPVVAGSFLNRGASTSFSPNRVVINERTREALGFASAEDAVGQVIYIGGSSEANTISGVTADFYLESMHSQMPLIMWRDIRSESIYRFFSFRLRGSDLGRTMEELRYLWKSLMPDAPFEYQFMDETISRMYKTELQLQVASIAAAMLSLVIVVLGVVALVSIMVRQRVKEIGVRKVLGASQRNIVGLFLKSFSWEYLIATVIAVPIVVVAMQRWLDNYYLKVDLELGIFLWPIIGLLSVVVLFVVLQSRHVVRVKPIDSLRDE